MMEIHKVKIVGSGDASAVVLQNGGEMDLIDTNVQHNGTGTGANYGVRVVNGGSVFLINSEIVFEQSGSSGSFVGFRIAGDDGGGGFSEGGMRDSHIEVSDFSGTMTLIALSVGDGNTTPAGDESVSIEVFGGILFAEGGASNSAIFVDTDADAFFVGVCLETAGNALVNNGLCEAINTLFDGARTGAGTTTYSQCTAFTGSGPAPIIDSLTAVP